MSATKILLQRTYFLILLFGWLTYHDLYAQQQIRGSVQSKNDGKFLSGVSIRSLVQKDQTMSDQNGNFTLRVAPAGDTVIASSLGYGELRTPIKPGESGELSLVLTRQDMELEEVMIHTGYYTLPRERATGSFTHVNQAQLNQSNATNILHKLEGVTNGLQFDRSGIVGEDLTSEPKIRIRGVSTLHADERPLIIVDNYPYDGDIESINPQDVESVTILKDAAAASIWGARAGNGVIVINLKSSQYDQPVRIDFRSTIERRDKPDLFYSQDHLDAGTIMDIQKELLERGVYRERNNTVLPMYVEWLIKLRDGQVDEETFRKQEAIYRNTDMRQQALDHLYQVADQRQYNLSISGGEKKYRYRASAGMDKGLSAIRGNADSRLTLNLQNSFMLTKRLELDASLSYTSNQTENNGINYTRLGIINEYMPLIGPNGESLPVVIPGNSIRYAYLDQAEDMGLLDWRYRPVDEIRLADNSDTRKDVRFRTGLNYRLPIGLNVHASYQYGEGTNESRNFYHAESYFARHAVNRLTQADGTKIVPDGAILTIGELYRSHTNMGRLQLNYDAKYFDRLFINVLAGAEAREGISKLERPPFTYFGFNPDTERGYAQTSFDPYIYYPARPQGVDNVKIPYSNIAKTVNRDLSYFSNAALSWADRYVLSGSVRWDGSNLLGVKSNQRGTALWSVGGSWLVSEESFFPSSLIPYMRLRTTVGSAGNIDKSQGHYPVIGWMDVEALDITIARLEHPGNPSLRWEQVNTFNLALDWAILDRKVQGTLEWYQKKSRHLLSNLIIDPTTGVGDNYKENYAGMDGEGLDITLTGRFNLGTVKFNNTLLVNYTTNKVSKLSIMPEEIITSYFFTQPYVLGKSRDIVYSIPWNGLDPQTGLPLIYKDGQVSTDYRTYFNSLTDADLLDGGLSVAPIFGSLNSGFQWKGLGVNFLLTYKGGNVFRRKSMEPGIEHTITGHVYYHQDYYRRWQKPGDELFTDVPRATENHDSSLGNTYLFSKALITPADYIRLQRVQINYVFESKGINKLGVRSCTVFGGVNNIGILWKKNQQGIDPEYPHSRYPAPRSYTFGLQFTF